MYKMINYRGHLTKTARDAFRNAYIAGGDDEMIVFQNAYANAHKFKQVTDIIKSINVAWYTFNADVYVIRHWFIEAISDRSKTALDEVKSLID